MKVLYGKGEKDIISQYVDFTKVYNRQVKLHGRTRKAILETIQICRESDVLKEYLGSHEKEVINIMMTLFDQQNAIEQFGYEKKEEGKLEGKKEAAFNMKKKGCPDTMIADFLEVGLNIVQGWFTKSTTSNYS